MTGILKVDQIQNIEDASSVKVNRTTSDGTVLDIQKDGTSAGTLKTVSGVTLALDAAGSFTGFQLGGSGIVPRKGGTLSTDVDLGTTSYPFDNVFVGNSVYLGGTGSGNALDDYEIGTFTPVFESTGGGESVSHNIQQGNYTKIGRLVLVQILIRSSSYSGGSGSIAVSGLPFASFSGYQQGVSCNEVASWNTNAPTSGYISPGATRIILAYINTTNMVTITPSNMNTGSNSNLVGIHAVYMTS